MIFEGKTALITGGAGGIGQAIAKELKSHGAHVIISDIRQVGDTPYTYYTLDVTKEDDWKAVFEKIDKLDILVNCAGIVGVGEGFGAQNPEDIVLRDMQSIMDVNFFGTVLGCKYGIAHMKKSGGAIINISSRCGLIGRPRGAAYSASKAAVQIYTKSVALHCAQHGYNIRCNAITPGPILTPMLEGVLAHFGGDLEASKKKLAEQIPLCRIGDAQDVAHAVTYFASDASSYVTGTNILLDGGIMAG